MNYLSVEITNKMQLGNGIYYSNGGIINSITKLHLVGYFY